MNNTNEYYCVSDKNIIFNDDDEVIVRKCGNSYRFLSSLHHSNCSKTQRCGNGRYRRTSDGTIHELKQHPERIPNMYACRKLEQIILGHCTCDYSLFSTLTYSQDRKYGNQTYEDFKYFIKHLRRKYDQGLDYIVVTEMQKRGTPHFHLLTNYAEPVSRIYNSMKDMIAASWKHGSVDTEKIYDVSGLAKYLLKDYFDPETMKVFPKGKKKYHTSRSISKFEYYKISGAEANRQTKELNIVRERQIVITNEKTGLYEETYQVLGVSKNEHIQDYNIEWESKHNLV